MPRPTSNYKVRTRIHPNKPIIIIIKQTKKEKRNKSLPKNWILKSEATDSELVKQRTWCWEWRATQKRKNDLEFRNGSRDLVPLRGVHLESSSCKNSSTLSYIASLLSPTFLSFSVIFSLLSIPLWECESEIQRFKKKRESWRRFPRGDNPTLPPTPPSPFTIHHSPLTTHPIHLTPHSTLLTSSHLTLLKNVFKKQFTKVTDSIIFNPHSIQIFSNLNPFLFANITHSSFIFFFLFLLHLFYFTFFSSQETNALACCCQAGFSILWHHLPPIKFFYFNRFIHFDSQLKF